MTDAEWFEKCFPGAKLATDEQKPLISWQYAYAVLFTSRKPPSESHSVVVAGRDFDDLYQQVLIWSESLDDYKHYFTMWHSTDYGYFTGSIRYVKMDNDTHTDFINISLYGGNRTQARVSYYDAEAIAKAINDRTVFFV